ncbi:MAG: ketol-acid reductoisomerase [Kiritimatiellae bacterium]|nr:ketol-acid reductoisomerase [Kiritimatiellia bacterium]MBP5226166.1 ketol-acid reductoisomerase [Kiritimatiellia bacterium]
MAKMDFGGVIETVVTRKEFPLKKALQVLKKETIAVIGYGVQGPAQSLNMRDNGFNVIVGQSKKFKKDWQRAVKDGWVPGKTLFDIDEACAKGTIINMLVTDAAQMQIWPVVKQYLTAGKALYFSHGFSIEYSKYTKIIPPKDVDVIMVAPKGSGLNVRRNFLSGAGINSSYAVQQDATGRAEERTKALGIAIGSGYLFPTTFRHEVSSDLTGERGVLMGALCGMMEAQYEVLRENGHTPSEAFNETVEELTQSLIRLVDENGMDWMYKNCSATAQHGALKWRPIFKKANLPVFKRLYKSVVSGTECKEVLRDCGAPDYKEKLDAQLNEMANTEMWKAGAACRSLRPHEKARDSKVGIAGRKTN